MQKTIILIDNHAKVVDLVLENRDCRIAVLVVYSEKDKKKYTGNPRVLSVYTMAEMNSMDAVENMDYSLLGQFKATQLKVENCLNRQTQDYQIRKYVYYTCLSFWVGIFEKYAIDAVLIEGLTHGYPHDVIPSDIAISKGIPSYNIENCTPFKKVLYDNLHDCFCPLNIKTSLAISDVIFYNSGGARTISDAVLKRRDSSQGKGRFKYVVAYILLRLFGVHIFKFLLILKNRSVYTVGNYGWLFRYTFFQELYSAHLVKKNRKYLCTLEEEIVPGEKYVFFALHMEPEANITARTILDSQLMAIQMLSLALPKDWKVYVKEHPQQNDEKSYSFYLKLYLGEIYRSKFFYDSIKNMKNVRMIKAKTKSKDLIENSRAVATISGTSSWEAVFLHRPCIIFGKRNPLRLVDDVFYVSSSAECYSAVRKIKNRFEAKYSDFESITRTYLADGNEYGYREIIKSFFILLNNNYC